MQRCRLAEGNEQAATTRADYLSTEMLLERYRKMAIEKRSLEFQIVQLRTALAACRAKANTTLTQRLNLCASQDAVGAIATELTRAHDAGKLEDNDSMLTFIADLVKSLRLGDNKNMRWTSSSHKIFQVLLKLGGARTFLMFRSTLGAPDIRTVQKRWADTKLHFKLGIDRDVMIAIASLYKDLAKHHGIRLPVPIELSVDETAIAAKFSWSGYWKVVVGGITGVGSTEWERSHYALQAGLDAYQQFITYVQGTELAGYLSVECINVLHDKLPSLPLVLRATNNKFKRDDVIKDWQELDVVFREVFDGIFELTGHSSDGDGRRFSVQQQQMPSTDGTRYACRAPCFTYTALLRDDGSVEHLNNQTYSTMVKN